MEENGVTVNRRKAICSNCRKRKSKCDGRLPHCSTCVAYKNHCRYEKPPSMAYVRSLEAKVEKLQLQLNGGKSQDQRVGIDNTTVTTTNRTPESHSIGGASESNHSFQETIVAEPGEKGDGNSWASQISVDGHGGVSFHNPTSVFHEAPSPDDSLTATGGSSIEVLPGSEFGQHAELAKQSLVSNAANQKRLEVWAIENFASAQNDIPRKDAMEFLRFHWCWIHPMFMFVYRPAFTRDMALSSPENPETHYFSETLLRVLLAHSARFRVQNPQYSDSANGVMNVLAHQAQLSLAMRITGTSSISTVQALLQQSARDSAFGNSSQAWLYAGMAFRIAIDLGIHLSSDKLRGYVRSLTAEDIEIRKRLFWSCYTWDKAISLYLGRMPAFTPSVKSNPPAFMDDFTEHDLWEPFYGPDDNQTSSSRPHYPPQKAYMISCFTGLCKLSTILATIMLEIYGSSPESRAGSENSPTEFHADAGSQNPKTSAFLRISSFIHNWWIELADTVRLDIKDLPAISPPLHIVSLNLLYHTTLILLHRPFIVASTTFESPAAMRSYQICIEAAASIHDLLVLLTSTFGYGHTTYLNCYSTYIAATISVLHFQLQEDNISIPESDVPSEKLALKFFLGVLQNSAVGMPGLERSIAIIKRHMQTILDRRSKKYLASLFPDADPNTQLGSHAFSSDTQSTLQNTNPHATTESHSVHSQASGTYHDYNGTDLESLPAFPGQDFNMGLDCTFDQEPMDPELRAMVLGLDPHLTLNHENSDWTYGGFYL